MKALQNFRNYAEVRLTAGTALEACNFTCIPNLGSPEVDSK